ncbi:MAG: FMN-binding protein [Clostridia bacterium]|nr:FMN-binding protein [Clostridia bacterium]
MKKLCALILLAIMLVSALSCAAAATLTDGTYEGVSQGMNGPVTVHITVKDGAIQEIIVPENKETKSLGDLAGAMLAERIKANQSLAVDTVSGATITSYAVLRAAQQALEQAGDITRFQQAAEKRELVQGGR